MGQIDLKKRIINEKKFKERCWESKVGVYLLRSAADVHIGPSPLVPVRAEFLTFRFPSPSMLDVSI